MFKKEKKNEMKLNEKNKVLFCLFFKLQESINFYWNIFHHSIKNIRQSAMKKENIIIKINLYLSPYDLQFNDWYQFQFL